MLETILERHICPRFLEDPHYREGHIRIINPLPGRKVLGLHIPEMKAIAREIAAGGNAQETVAGLAAAAREDASSLCHEDLMVWGFVINALKCPLPQRLEMLSDFVPAIDNWAVCDSFCSNAKWMARCDGRELLEEVLGKYFTASREFEVRFAVVSSMCYLLGKEHIREVFRRIAAIDYGNIVSMYRKAPSKGIPGTVAGEPPYYVRMAVAWLLATALAKEPALTRAFVRTATLPDDVVRLYVRKARESFRTRGTEAL